MCDVDDKYCKLPEVDEHDHITREKDALVMGMDSVGKFVTWVAKVTDPLQIPHQHWNRSLFNDAKYFTLSLKKNNKLLHGFNGKKLTSGPPYMTSTHQKIFKHNQHFFPIFFRNFYHALDHGLRTPNECINRRYLKNRAYTADKICFGRT